MLTAEIKETRVTNSYILSTRYDRGHFRLVIYDGTWLNHYDPGSKQELIE